MRLNNLHDLFIVMYYKQASLCSGRASASSEGGGGFDPWPGHTKYFTMVVMISPSLALRIAGLALRLTGWCQDKWTSRTDNRKRRDITEILLQAALNTKQSIICL